MTVPDAFAAITHERVPSLRFPATTALETTPLGPRVVTGALEEGADVVVLHAEVARALVEFAAPLKAVGTTQSAPARNR
jgi:hypothetical protein